MKTPIGQLELFDWTPPPTVIPFPASLRHGHTRKVARQLLTARSEREASYIIERAANSMCCQMERAGISYEVISKQIDDYLIAIYGECTAIEAPWVPHLPSINPPPHGAA